jgi:hypothetical protein
MLAAILLLAGTTTQAADSVSSVTVLTAYYSGTGNTEKMARPVASVIRRRSAARPNTS